MVDQVLHRLVVLPQEDEQTVADEEIIAWWDSLKRKLWQTRAAVLIHKECVGSVRAAGVQPLEIVLPEQRGPHLHVDDAWADEVDALQWLVLTQNHFVFAELDVLHAVAYLLE